MAVKCVWCGHYTPSLDVLTCTNCGLSVHAMTPEVSSHDTPAHNTKKKKARRQQPERIEPWDSTPVGRPIMGVDPGARYTGVVVRDGGAVLHASTLVRPVDMGPTAWALSVVEQLRVIHTSVGECPMAVEGVSDPKGFTKGKRDPINPAWIMRAAVVLGAVVAVWPDACVVPPGGNGAKYARNYPPELVGRRPAQLPGDGQQAGTRAHEQSAFDVAGKAERTLWPPERLLPA